MVEIKLSGAFITCGIFHIRDGDSQFDTRLVFNKNATERIENGLVVAATGASIKDGQIGGSWRLGNQNNRKLLSNKLCHKDWREKTLGLFCWN